MADIELTITVDEATARFVARHEWISLRLQRLAQAFAAALPKPRPAEPMGLGAVVRDGNGYIIVRTANTVFPWRGDEERRWVYANIPDPIEVLSEGVIL